MAELLVVMIVTGILFLLVFDGLGIIHRYNHILTERLWQKSHLLYSHQTLESLLEKSDSLCLYDHRLWVYTDGVTRQSLAVDSTYMVLHSDETADTLFKGLLDLRLYPANEDTRLIDSLIIELSIRKDTIRLHYETTRYIR
ncbi:MAG: hypothetical protein LBM62_05190 [Mediterranea sp.]|jgi:hypothetical protein|nr:hypothetical protein [Mediterranea sp.]